MFYKFILKQSSRIVRHHRIRNDISSVALFASVVNDDIFGTKRVKPIKLETVFKMIVSRTLVKWKPFPFNKGNITKFTNCKRSGRINKRNQLHALYSSWICCWRVESIFIIDLRHPYVCQRSQHNKYRTPIIEVLTMTQAECNRGRARTFRFRWLRIRHRGEWVGRCFSRRILFSK